MFVALTLLETAQKIASLVMLGKTVYDKSKPLVSSTSLADLAKLTRVEPLTIISSDLRNQDYMSDINQTCLSIFTSYYLQAVSVITKVKDVEVIRILESLNPNRDGKGFIETQMEKLSTEALSTRDISKYKYNLPTKTSLSLETTKDNVSAVNELTALSVGKLMNVELCYNVPVTVVDANGITSTTNEERKVTVPVNVRLIVSSILPRHIVQILASKTEDESLSERYHAWRAGRISFISDLVFCKDLIKEYKKSIISDDSNTTQEIYRRVHNAKKAGLASNNPSLAMASNIFIITKEEATSIGKAFLGRFNEPRVIKKVFDNTYAMIIGVVDRDMQRVSFHINGADGYTDLTFKELKGVSKGSGGSDVMEIFKALQMGHAPQHI